MQQPSSPAQPKASAPKPRRRAPGKLPSQGMAQAFAATMAFPLDRFQLEAIAHLEGGSSVLVAAPTGSGKTVVGEFAIFRALQLQRRCIYTTPLKALSNQKFRDLQALMGEQVGLVTGDVVIRPEAPILIMTTEILRNMLVVDPAQVDDVVHVVLDEAHYLGSDGRGTVWEETIVFLPEHVRLVALSATIPNADELARWVSAIHAPMHVVHHAERPVPLVPFVATRKGVMRLFDDHGRLRVPSFRDREGWVESPDLPHVVAELAKKDMLPGIAFVFSRQGCEREAQGVLRAKVALTSPAEQKAIRKLVAEALEATPAMRSSSFTMGWLERLPYGVAPHHAGLLPPMKLLIELLFQKNLLKFVVATETLAAGINMPARTVIISDLTKRSDAGHRALALAEFHQMTGRAGRRGMDSVGYGVVLASHRFDVPDVANYFKGEAEPLTSRFQLTYHLVANLASRYSPEAAKRIIEQSFNQYQNNALVADKLDARARLLEAMQPLEAAPCPKEPEHGRQERLRSFDAAKKERYDAHRLLQGLEANVHGASQEALQAALAAAPCPSWVVVRRPGSFEVEYGILLDKRPARRGLPQFGVLLDAELVTVLPGEALVLALGAPVPDLPAQYRDLASGTFAGAAKRVRAPQPLPWGAWLEALGLDPLQPPAAKEPEVLNEARQRAKAASQGLGQHPCTGCKHMHGCKEALAKGRGLQERLTRLDAEIQEVQARDWRRFQALKAVLEKAGFLAEAGSKLLPRGLALAHLRTQNELLAADAFTAGIFHGLRPEALAAVVSAVIAEPVRGRMAWSPRRPPADVGAACERLIALAEELYEVQAERGAEDMPLYVTTDYAGLVHDWAAGATWKEVVEASGIDEGQFVRHLRLVLDMMRQLQDLPGNEESFRERVMEAIACLDRDLVKEVF